MYQTVKFIAKKPLQNLVVHDKASRNVTDILWCHRFIAAYVPKFQEEIIIPGIDMILVLDIIKRTKLIEILESFLKEDEIRIIKKVLSNTTLNMRWSSNISKPFDINTCSPQGDGGSKCLFIISSSAYSPLPSRQKPCKWWALLCCQYPMSESVLITQISSMAVHTRKDSCS